MKTITLQTGLVIKQDSNGNIKSINCNTLGICNKPLKL